MRGELVEKGLELFGSPERWIEAVWIDYVVAVSAARHCGEDGRDIERLDTELVKISDLRPRTRETDPGEL